MIVNIKYCLEPKSAFHVGSGLGGAGIKRRLLRQSDGEFAIPGSTVKGRVRHYCREFVACCPQLSFKKTDIDVIFGKAGDGRRGESICAFSDLTLIERESRSHIRNGIQISRELGITKPHALFNTEVISCDRFKGKILWRTSNKCDERFLVLLLIGLRLLYRLGGSKTFGLGKCEVPLSSIKVNKNTEIVNIEELLSHVLEEGE